MLLHYVDEEAADRVAPATPAEAPVEITVEPEIVEMPPLDPATGPTPGRRAKGLPGI